MLSRGITRRAVVIGGLCAVLLVLAYLTAVWTATGQRFEDAVLSSAVGGRQDAAVGALDAITVWSLAAAVLVVFALGRLRGGPLLGLTAAGVIVAAVLITEVLQYTLPRPLLLAHGYRREDHSFPSGHAAIAMSVTCALLLVVPHRFRAVAALPAALAAAGVGALTVNASWHRPSDVAGSALIVLMCVCAATALLDRRGALQPVGPARAGGGAERISGRAAVVVLAAGVLVELVVAVTVGARVAGELAASADPDLVPRSTLIAGRAAALADGGLVVLGLLILLRGTDLRPGVTNRSGRRPAARSGGRQAEPTIRPTGRAH